MAGVVQNPSRNAEIVRLRGLGFAPAEIARRLDIGRNTVLGVLYRNGLTDKNCPRATNTAYTPALRAMILETRRTAGVRAAARFWNVSTSTISSWSRGL